MMQRCLLFLIFSLGFTLVSAHGISPSPSVKKFAEKTAQDAPTMVEAMLYPRHGFINLLKKSGAAHLTLENYTELYNKLHHIAGIQGLPYVQKNYPDLLEMLKETLGKEFDPTLKKYYPSTGPSKVINPLQPFHRTLLFGAIDKKKYRTEVYADNILIENYDGSPLVIDLQADMLNADHLKHLPDEYFEKIYVEHVGRQSYYPEFLKNARRLLAEDGVLVFNIFDSLDDPYSPKNSPAYFKKNGFNYADIRQCHFPRIQEFMEAPYDTQPCWHLKKHAPDSFFQRLFHNITLEIKCFFVYQLRDLAYRICHKLLVFLSDL